MKQFTKALVVVGAIGVTNVYADCIDSFHPVMGADFYQVWMQGKGSYSKIFPKSYPGASVYVGTRCFENFGIEFGFDWSGRKSRNWTLTQGQSFQDRTLTTALSGTTKIRRIGGHIDVMGIMPIFDCFEVFGTVGYGWVQSKLTIVNVSPSPGVSNMSSAVATLSGKGRSVFRAGIGTNLMVTDCVGIRAKVGFETTSSLQLKGNAAARTLGYNSNGFRDSGTLAIGAFAKF